RWPTMDALLGALAPRGKRRLPWAAAAVAVVGAAAWWLSPDACVRPPAEIWAPARDAAAEQFRDATPAYIGATWPAVSAALDMYETRWRDQSLAACQTSGARSEVERARATDCLDHRKAELAHLVGGLARGAAPALATALSAASSLPAADVCNSDASLSTWQVIDDPRERAQRDEARAWLREARDALALGKTVRGVGDVSAQVERGIEAGRRAQQRAADLGDRATESHARFLLAQLHLIAGDVTAAEAEAHGAATTAERGGDARARIRALSFQAYVVGQNRDRLGEARQLAAQAMAALDAGGGDDLLRAQLLNNLANVAARARPPQFEAALADHREALALLTDAAGLDHPETISAQLNLGATLNRAGQAQEALEQLEAAATRAETLWGREHPRYAKASRILGLAQLRAGRLDAAYQRLSHALAVHERVYGATHPEVANDLYNVALVERRRSRHAEAIALLRRGIEIREAHAGSKHPELIPWLVLEGRSALDLAHDADARDVLDRALRLCELDGAQPLEFAKIRALLARATVRVDAPRAAALAQQARDAYVRAGDYPEQVAKLDALIADAGRVRASP
ncbi:MAG: tetratricopeptide repeat protein, partial [Myxococcota bacterium]